MKINNIDEELILFHRRKKTKTNEKVIGKFSIMKFV